MAQEERVLDQGTRDRLVKIGKTQADGAIMGAVRVLRAALLAGIDELERQLHMKGRADVVRLGRRE